MASPIMSTTVVVTFAGHYQKYAQQASATLLITALAMVVVLLGALVIAAVVRT